MYCKKCGHSLSEGDKFCPGCGAKVETKPTMFAENDFVPPFKREPETKEEGGEDKPKRSFQFEEFNWDLDGYPTSGATRKTEDIDFNWESVMDERDRSLKEQGSMAVPSFLEKKESDKETTEAEEADLESSAEESAPEEEKSIEEEIFGDGGINDPDLSKTRVVNSHEDLGKTTKIDKFYTYNKKNEEFQALLDQEYNRLKAHIEGDEPDYEAAAEKIESSRPEGQEPVKAEAPVPEAEVPQVKVVQETYRSMPDYVGVVVPETPANIIAFDQAQAAVNTEETAEADPKPAVQPVAIEEPETPATVVTGNESVGGEKEEPQSVAADAGGSTSPAENKLTFGDVFADDEDEMGKDNGPKKHTGLKVLAVILCILVVLQVAVICIKELAPESAASIQIQEIYNNIFGGIRSLFG